MAISHKNQVNRSYIAVLIRRGSEIRAQVTVPKKTVPWWASPQLWPSCSVWPSLFHESSPCFQTDSILHLFPGQGRLKSQRPSHFVLLPSFKGKDSKLASKTLWVSYTSSFNPLQKISTTFSVFPKASCSLCWAFAALIAKLTNTKDAWKSWCLTKRIYMTYS